MLPSADLNRDSESIRKFACVTTSSPGWIPSRISKRTIDLCPGPHVARLEPPLPLGHEDDGSRPRREHGPVGHGHDAAERPLEREVRVHLGLQALVGVVERDADLDRPRLLIENGGDEGGPCPSRFARVDREAHPSRLPDGDERRFGFVHVGHYPDAPDPGDIEERVGRHDAGPLDGILRHHEAVDRGVESQRLFGFSGLLEFGDFAGADVPQEKALARRFVEIYSSAGDVGIRRRLKLPAGAERDQVLLLHGQKLGAVDRQQRLPLANGFPRVVDIEALHVTFEFRVNLGVQRLVEGHMPHGSDLLDEVSALRLSELNADRLFRPCGNAIFE